MHRIEGVEVGDRVVAFDTEQALAATSTDAWEEGWVKVQSDADVKSSAWSPRWVCSRLARAGRKAVLPAMLAACDPSSAAVELPSDVAVVQVYDARTGVWDNGLVGELEVGDEVLHEGHLLRVTDEGVEDRGFAEVGQLSDADATWTVDGVASVPDGDDWVLVLGDAADAGHWRLQDLTVGERFAFGGRVFESDVIDGELAVRATGEVLGRVVNTFVRMAPEVIDGEIAYADGTTDVLTGTPNHPFWVDAVRDYVPLGDLKVGTELHVQGGGDAVLVSKTWRQGDFEVFDFEVEGLHNFYVRGEGSDAAGVLVHNSKASKAAPGSGTHRAGPEKAWRSGAEPNSKWTQTSGDGTKAVQNTVYDAEGNAVGQVDFKRHGAGAPPGHGHTFPPGQPATGHGPGATHIDPADVPEGWADIPPGLEPAQ